MKWSTQISTLARLVKQRSAMMAQSSSSWRYDNQSAWRDLPNSASDGQRQSPIAISTSETRPCSSLQELNFINWDQPISGMWRNGGHALQFTPDQSSQQTSLKTHKGLYTLVQFHFHCGQEGSPGSEHTVDGMQLDAELHLVMKDNTKPENSGDQFTVVGVMLESSDDKDTSFPGVWSQLQPAPKFSEERQVTGLVCKDLLPKQHTYYYYEGSLTTPPCSEIVQWILLKQIVKTPRSFLAQLRHVGCDQDGVQQHYSFRALQQLNGRCVWKHD